MDNVYTAPCFLKLYYDRKLKYVCIGDHCDPSLLSVGQ